MSEATTIGEYEVLERLGEGAAGVAFKARHKETGEVVALKLLHGRLQGDMDLERRFIREASVLEKLSHPNIVGHRDCGIHDDKFYLAMEYVDSGTLDDIIKQRGALPWRLAVEGAIKVLRALQHAHEQGVIHRDLKPANLFLSGDGEVKVGDFGLARDLDQHRLTVEGQTVGTCRYMAPEQVQGQADLTGAVDLYALGCLMFRMITGNPPFDGVTIVEVFEKHLFTDPPKLSDRVPGVPKELDQVVQRLMAKEPRDRPKDADAARELFELVLSGDPLPPPPEGQSSPNLTEQLTAGPTGPQPNMKVLLGVIGGVAVAGLVAWLLFGGG